MVSGFRIRVSIKQLNATWHKSHRKSASASGDGKLIFRTANRATLNLSIKLAAGSHGNCHGRSFCFRGGLCFLGSMLRRDYGPCAYAYAQILMLAVANAQLSCNCQHEHERNLRATHGDTHIHSCSILQAATCNPQLQLLWLSNFEIHV